MSLLTYALIALGGAIGSVARAWLGTALAALTGPAFPWGTIAINVLGSFVIGLFGTLTATDGRFAASFDTRAFVMVGLCGGFTTFSSFSLQTLELLRDGRAGQALGNAVLSVALCLAGVAAGCSLALTIRTSRLAVAADTHGALVALHRPEAVEGMLAAVRRLIGSEDGRITVLLIDGPALAEFQPTEEVLTQERRREAAAWRTGWAGAMRSALDRSVAAEQRAGHPVRRIEIRGDGLVAVSEHGRGARLLLLERMPGDADARLRIHAALARAHRPVLMVPSGHSGRFGRVIAVARLPGGGTGAALRTAMPLLSAAERVVVLQVGEAEPLPAPFDRLPIQSLTAAPADGDAGAWLLAMAHRAGADLLVLGIRSQGRPRERRFDGTTDTLLRIADLPVLMQREEASVPIRRIA